LAHAELVLQLIPSFPDLAVSSSRRLKSAAANSSNAAERIEAAWQEKLANG